MNRLPHVVLCLVIGGLICAGDSFAADAAADESPSSRANETSGTEPQAETSEMGKTPESVESADIEEESRTGMSAEEKETSGKAQEEQEFHLDPADIEDLRDADVVLPNIDEFEGEGEAVSAPEEGSAIPEAEHPSGTGDEPGAEESSPLEPPRLENPQEVVDRVIKNMDRSAEMLGPRKDPGESTQKVQRHIVEDLDGLIEYVKQFQMQQSRSSSQQRRQSRRDSQEVQRQPQQQGPQQSQSEPKSQRSRQAMQDEFATQGHVQEEKLKEVEKLLEEQWGNLLPNAPRETLQGIREMILPKYRRLLSRYFYALARSMEEKEEE